MIIEGVGSGRLDWAPALASLVWIETSAEVRLRRGLERDGADAIALRREGMAAEDRYQRQNRPKQKAVLIAAGAPHTTHDPAVEFIRLAKPNSRRRDLAPSEPRPAGTLQI